jgi:hypothetical protein
MKTIKNPISGEKIQLSEMDFPETMIFKDASISCKQLGQGWRLPSKYEWEVIFNELMKSGDKSFDKTYYWTGSFIYDPSNNALAINTKNGQMTYRSVDHLFKVRAVKTLTS